MKQEIRGENLVAEGFVPTKFALVHDTLRISNRLSRNFRFVVHICKTGDADVVKGLGGIFVRAIPFQMEETWLPDNLVVLGGRGIQNDFEHLKARLRWFGRIGSSIILLSDAASEWKKLHSDRDRYATHWEIHQHAQDVGFADNGDLPFCSQFGRVTTAAGMPVTAGVVLGRVVAAYSTRLAQAVGQALLMGGIRKGSARQPRSKNDVNTLRPVKLHAVVSSMEESERLSQLCPLGATRPASLVPVGHSSRRQRRLYYTRCRHNGSARQDPAIDIFDALA